jgi:hypothetical protein
MSSTHHAVHALADQLVVEYAGALPPGQVLALVYRTAHRLAHLPSAGPDWQTGTCERLVREALTERLATQGRVRGAA